MMNALSPSAMYGTGAAPAPPGTMPPMANPAPPPMANPAPQARPVETHNTPFVPQQGGGFMAHQNMFGQQQPYAQMLQRFPQLMQQFPRLAAISNGFAGKFGGGQMTPGGGGTGAPLQGNPGTQPTGVMPTQPQMMPPQMMPPQAQQGMVGSAYGVTGATPALGGFGLPTY